MYAIDVENREKNFIAGTLFALLAALAWCAPLMVLVVYLVSGSYLVSLQDY